MITSVLNNKTPKRIRIHKYACYGYVKDTILNETGKQQRCLKGKTASRTLRELCEPYLYAEALW